MSRLLLSISALLCWTMVSGQLTAPFTESFDTQGVPSGWTNTNLSSSTSTYALWKWGNASTNSMGYPSSTDDHTGNNGFFAWADGSSPEEAGVILETDSIDISALTVPALEFYLLSNNTTNPGDNVTLTVEYYDGSQWNTVLTYAGDDPDWVYQIVDLSSYTGTGKKVVRFTVDQTTTSSSAFYNDFAIDDISVLESPSCLPPSNLSVANITSVTADLSWSAISNASSGYEVIYGAMGFDPAMAGNSVAAATNSVTVSSLSPNTDYDFYVIADCGTTDGISDTAGPVSFTTLCAVFTAPYLEDFELGTGTTPPACWTNEAEGGSEWDFTTGTGQIPSSSDGDHTYGPGNGGIMAWIDDSDDEDSTNLLSPLVDISSFTTPRLTFWMWSETNSSTSQQFPLHIDVKDSQGWHFDVAVIDTENTGWERFIVDLSSFGDTVQVRFSGEDLDGSFYKDIAIDDVSFEETPTCDILMAAGINGVTSSQATLYLPADSNASFSYTWGPCGFDQGSSSVYHSTGTNGTATLTGLMGNTCYDVYVRRMCSSTDSSALTGPYSFTTLCNPFTAPYTQDFDGTVEPDVDNCWSFINSTTSTASFAGTENFRSNSGTNSFELYNSSSTSGDLMLISPEFSDLDNTKQVSFYIYDDNDGANLIVGTMSDPTDAATFTAYDTITSGVMPNDEWARFTVRFNSYTGTDSYIAFKHDMSVSTDYLYIDDVEYDFLPSCLSPDVRDLGSQNITSNSAEVYWGTNSNGDETHLEWGLVGFTPGTSSNLGADSVSGAIDTFNITGLLPQTSYEVYVRDSCASGSFSAWVGPITFTTACGVLTAPHTESFDNTTIPNCWSTYSSTSETWTFGSNSYAPSSDHTGNGGEYATVDDSESPSSGDVTLESPRFDVSSLTNPELKFFLASQDATVTLTIDVWDGSTWHIGVFTHAAATTSTWEEVSLNLIPFSGSGEVAVRFVVDEANGTFQNDIAIDDVSIQSGPSCPDPVALSVVNISDTSATLDWAGFSGANNHEVWFGPDGFYQGTQSTVGGARIITTGDSLVLDTLTPNTCYEFVVRSICGPGDTSGWAGPVSFCTPCSNQLNGTYTIGGTAGPNNFPTMDDAITFLNDCGISGSVVFNIVEGTYNEQVLIHEISGSSAANTVTFQPDPSNVNPVVITYSGTGTSDNYVWGFDGADYVIVKGLTLTAGGTTYSRVIDFSGESHHITIEDNILNGMANAGSTSNYRAVIMNNTTSSNRLDSTIIRGNEINGGSYGLYFYGPGSSDMEFANTIDSNIIDGFHYYGINSYYQDGISLNGNTVTSANTYSTVYGMDLNYNDNFEAIGNRVVVRGTSTNYGLYVYYSDASSASPSIVANNMVSALDNSGTTYALDIYYSNYVDVMYNSAYVNAGSSSAGHALYITGSTSSTTGVRLFNNNVINTGGGAAFEATAGGSSAITASDYNNFYATGATLASWDGTSVTDLAGLRGESSMDSNSVSGDPVYVAGDDLHAQGSVNNNVATPIAGITIDIDGEVRSATTPDIGADEFTPLPGDLALIGGEFIKGLCLSTNDSILLMVQNLIGITKNFANDPLTVTYSVAGPVNSSGTVIVNSGTVNTLDTFMVYAGGIDLSVPGVYTLNAYIDSNDVNILASNDTLVPAVDIEVYPEFGVNPQSVTMTNMQDSVKLCTESSFFNGANGFIISEVCHYKYSVGEPANGWPSYLIADDYIEITGVPGSDLAGVTLEQWSTSALVSTHTFPAGTVLSPDGTAIIAVGQLGSSAPSPSDYYYHGNGSYTGLFSSGGNNGRILKDANGNIIDAVGVGSTYSFPAAAGVSSSDWSGTSGNHTTTSGVRLTGPDLNNASNWVVSSSADPQDPNVVNSGVPVPSASGTSGLIWTLNGVTVDSTSCITVGPFSSSGTYTYVATYTNACGTFTDSAVVIVPSCLPPFNLSASKVLGTSAMLHWDTISGNGNNDFQVSYGAGIQSPGDTGANLVVANADSLSVTGLNGSTDYCFYVREICAPGDTSAWAGPYCFETPCLTKVAPYFENFENNTVGHYEGENNCWDFISNNAGTSPSGGFSWEVRNTPQTTSTNTGPAGDNTFYPTVGGNWIHSDNSGGSSGDSTVLLSPIVDISGLSNPELEYHFHNFASPTSNFRQPLYVDIYDGNTWHNKVHEIDSVFQSSETDPWKDTIIDLAPYSANGLIQVRFRTEITRSAGGAGDVAIDDIRISDPISCVAPSNLVADANSAVSAEVSWDTTGVSATSYVVEYGSIGFTPGTGTAISSASNSAIIAGLGNNLCMEAYVRAVCSSNDSSFWVGPVSVCPEEMTCDSLDQYAAGPVDGQSALFKPWQGAAGDAEFSTAQAASGSTSMRIYDSGPAGMSDVVAYFDTISSGAWEVEFDMYIPSGKAGYFNIQQNHALSGIGNLWGGEIYFQANGTAQAEYGSSVAGTFSYTQGQWIDISVIIDLDNDSVWFEYNGTSTGVGYDYSLANVGAPLQFNGINFYSGVKTGDQADFYVDNFCINPFFSGACPAPTGLASNNEGCDSTEVSWSSFATGAYALVEYGPVGFTPGSGTLVSLVQSPYVITGLTPGTAYEFYVADTCGADTSNWSGPVSFTTLSGPLPVASFTASVNGFNVSFDANASTGATTYSWDFGDGNMGSGDTISHTYATGGTQTVTLTATNACGTDDTTIVLTDVSLEENMLQQSLTVYPNPAKDEVHVSFENSGSSDVVIRVLDLSGKEMIVKQSEIGNGKSEQTLSIGKLADGVYILEVSNGTIKGNKRLIKQ